MRQRIITTALLTASLALPAGVFAQGAGTPATSETQQRDRQESQMQGQQKDRQKDKMKHGKSGEIRRVSSEELEQKVTARKLLDQAVYDQEGNRIGDVTDFAVGNALPQELSQKLQRGESLTAGSVSAATGSQDRAIGSARATGTTTPTGTTGVAGGTTATTGSNQSPGIGASTGSMSYDTSGLQQDREITLFVRVGGTLGIGGDTVAIPISELDYDSEEERFTVSISQDEINAIAEGRDEIESREVSSR